LVLGFGSKLVSMKRFFQFAIVLMWIALPIIALEYQHAWDQLPARMATHFSGAGQPNGWMQRDVALEFGLGIMLFLLVVLTPVLWYISRKKVDVLAWALLGFSVLILGFAAYGNQSVLNYNLRGTPVRPDWALVVVPTAIVVLMAIFLAMKRGHPLPHSELIAEETQTGRGWAMLILLAMIVPAVAAIAVPVNSVRFGMALVTTVGLAAIGMAWSGFQYRFLHHGVEVRTLGFRLRSIPRQQILSYGIEPWALWRGYDIRGVGDCRAYTWGNKVVHIRTSNGEVYLGHSDPDRIVHDLDLVKGSEAAAAADFR